MYLSELTLNARHAQARRDLGDAYEMHRSLARAFSLGASSSLRPFLWRLERSIEGPSSWGLSSIVLVQSADAADWSALESIPGYLEGLRANKFVDLENLVQAGRRYRFRLLANPTVTRGGKRHGLVREEEQLGWLARQGQAHGFSVLGCVRNADERLQVRQSRTGNHITVQTTLFEGILQVQCAEALRRTMACGLGHARALGLGLLSIARID